MQSSTTKNCPCQGATLVRFVQPIILSTLSRGPSHGHLLLEKIACTRLWGGSPPDPAGVYRTLRGMEQRGLISSRQTVGMGRSFINVSLIAVLRSVQRGSSRKKTAQLSNGTAVRRKRTGESGTPQLLEKIHTKFL